MIFWCNSLDMHKADTVQAPAQEDPMKKTYVQIMRELREDNDRTQQEIADYLGTSQTMYARYERGANELPIRHLIRLCEYYHVSSDYFLGLSQNKKGPAGHRR